MKYLNILTTTCKCENDKMFWIGCLVGCILAIGGLFCICSIIVSKNTLKREEALNDIRRR